MGRSKEKKKRSKKRSRRESRSRSRSSSSSRSRSRSSSERSDVERREYKEKKRVQKKAEKVAKAFGYSNEINPFGDPNLLKPFVWGKKQEKDVREGRGAADPEAERLRLMMDIERVRRRREEREKELEEMERLRTEEARLREAAQHGDWMRKEEEYHVEQMKVRSTIRLLERRDTVVDRLAKSIILIEAAFSKDKKVRLDGLQLAKLRSDASQDPVQVLQRPEMKISELDQFIRDAEAYIQVEELKQRDASSSSSSSSSAPGGDALHRSADNIKFWRSLIAVAGGERRKRRLAEEEEASSGGSLSESQRRVHRAFEADIERILSGKSPEELENLAAEILDNIKSGRSTDVEYWQLIASEAQLEANRLRARDLYYELLVRQEDAVRELRSDAVLVAEAEALAAASDGDKEQDKDYEFLSGAAGRLTDASQESVLLQEAEADREMGASEEQMRQTDEVNLPVRQYAWQDKYRPRKPRYFNRVRTGFSWNRYNQTHYDRDNPPPKSIFGYKFNIFYPDLIDKSTTPQYFLEGSDDPGFAILRFHAGPPYEDIAFKVVSQQWLTGKHSGFRCVFERGVLQLHFNLKRYGYRR